MAAFWSDRLDRGEIFFLSDWTYCAIGSLYWPYVRPPHGLGMDLGMRVASYRLSIRTALIWNCVYQTTLVVSPAAFDRLVQWRVSSPYVSTYSARRARSFYVAAFGFCLNYGIPFTCLAVVHNPFLLEFFYRVLDYERVEDRRDLVSMYLRNMLEMMRFAVCDGGLRGHVAGSFYAVTIQECFICDSGVWPLAMFRFGLLFVSVPQHCSYLLDWHTLLAPAGGWPSYNFTALSCYVPGSLTWGLSVSTTVDSPSSPMGFFFFPRSVVKLCYIAHRFWLPVGASTSRSTMCDGFCVFELVRD